jgi:hypothetical protein
VNTSGQHIALWLNGSDAGLGWGQSSSYPYQEGSFFGNIFSSTPKAYFCNGKDFDLGVVPGRLGASQSGSPYSDPFGSGAACASNCIAPDAPYNNDGYKSCGAFTHVVTVWRNFDPNTNYKICNQKTTKCLDIQNSRLDDVAPLIQNTYSGKSSQKWKILQVNPGQYRVMNVNSGKAIDVGNGAKTDGAWMQQWTYVGGQNQLWTFTALGWGLYKFSPGSNPAGSLNVKGGTTVDGTLIEQWTYEGWNSERWSVAVAN